MLFLSKEDIQKCFSMTDAITACEQALKIYTQGKADVPLRNNISVKDFNGQTLYMPAATKGDIISSGIKIVSVYPENSAKGIPSVPATMILMDEKTGIVKAILDGTYLTQLRTGAVQGLATKIMARQDAQIGALIGTGGQAYQQAIAMLTVRNLDVLKVYSRDLAKAQIFVDKLQDSIKDKFNTQIVLAKSAQECVFEADIITTVTTSKEPTFEAQDIKKGVHINGVGSYTHEMIEMPKEALAQSTKIVFDTTDGVMSEAGDILLALEKKLITHDNILGELGEIVGKDFERTVDEITVFKTVGSAVLDVVTAYLVVEKAIKLGIGQEINI